MNDPAFESVIAQLTGHTPTDLALFEQALTHGSSGKADYQRLEFLGDRVLGLTVSHALYHRFPEAFEGDLSLRFNALVSGETCAEVSRALDLPALMTLGPQAIGDGGRYSDNIAADAIEALIGALYIDGGEAVARAFIMAHWSDLISGQRTAPKHPKAALQEWALARKRKPPEYSIVSRDGPDHAPRFRVSVAIGKLAAAEGEGTSKQAAEKAAAFALLEQVQGLEL